ncbi:Fibroblast growth factor receptor 3 [Orchesella cincta]|uniref:Fibroblast growth factor receptor 3 n=1 Tax=Orchesella cincta TaxID=48709 RepID=A0A1D2MT82_ORCCI|nr:Fibroblast growth factor receptor 3 [Orchesella cincta]
MENGSSQQINNNGNSTTEKSCASVTLASGGTVTLYENGILSKEDYERVRDNKLKRALFEVAVPLCVLEICGYSETNDPGSVAPYKYGTCEWYYGPRVRAPAIIYDPDYQVSSLSCACTAENSESCRQVTCQTEDPTWYGMQCAILYQETNCQSCFFQLFVLEYGKEFLSLNSIAVKSLKVRDGCTVEKYTNGALGWDLPGVEPLMYTSTDNDTGPVFHKDSENFTCYCDKEILEEMRKATTTTTTTTQLPMITGSTSSTTASSTTLATITEEDTGSFTQVLLIYILPGIGFILLLVGLAFISYYCYWTRDKKEVVTSNATANGGVDNGTVIEMQEIVASDDSNEEVETRLEPEAQFREEELKRLFHGWLHSLREPSQNQWQIPSLPPILPVGMSAEVALLDNFRLVCEPEFEINWERITDFGIPLGDGYFGLVYKGSCKLEPDGLEENVAIKKIKPNSLQSTIMSFLREIKILQGVGIHENIVRYVGSSCHNGQLFILTEFCGNGCLLKYLKNVMPSRLVLHSSDETDDDEDSDYPAEQSAQLSDVDLHQCFHWLEQIATGMEFLNAKKIIHVDLAVRNVLLTSDWTAKICDFGLSKTCIEDKDYAQSVLIDKIPVNYYAPDWINNSQRREDGERKVSVYIDIWAFGCTAWEIFRLGERPYYGLDGDGIKDLIRREERLEKPQLAQDFL